MTFVLSILSKKDQRFSFSHLVLTGLLAIMITPVLAASFPDQPASEILPGRNIPPAYQIIHFLEKEYAKKVEKIFEKHCFDCHIKRHRLNWWQRLPLLDHLVVRTREKSVNAFDLSGGFPFLGKRSLEDDLLSINRQIAKDKMPPPWIKFFSGDYSLKDSEKESVLFWTHLGIQMLRAETSQKHDQE